MLPALRGNMYAAFGGCRGRSLKDARKSRLISCWGKMAALPWQKIVARYEICEFYFSVEYFLIDELEIRII